jgi:Bacterial pre-peptidase C-terminal domain
VPHSSRIIVLACIALAGSASAQEKKDEGKKKEPRVTLVAPFAVTAGSTVTLKVRGLELSEAKEVRFPDAKVAPKAEVKAKAKVPVPEKLEAKDVGDTQVDVELTLPPETPAGDLALVVVTPGGETKPYSLAVAGSLTEEKEPNAGFRTAQQIPAPSASTTVRGAIQENNDVDVFRVTGKAGQTLKAEVTAARRGSALDAVLTLYGAGGRVLAMADDAGPDSESQAARDPSLSFNLPADGVYYLALNDANDRGSAAHPYLLRVSCEQ